MTYYKAPTRDIKFALFEVFHYEQHCQKYCPSLDAELLEALIEENARFCETVLAPLDAVGDREGCQLVNGQVKTPTGFKAAYQQFCDAGWPSLARSTEYGGQGLLQSLGFVMNEMSATAAYAWNMYSGLSQGAMYTIETHGSDEQKALYLPPLISGQWTGTMCLTESQAGTDLGLLTTRAEPLDDGRYAITGSKIFISSGDHDLSDNIVHIVLARLPDAPPGTKGLSLFIVPKRILNEAGEPGDANHISCAALEHKMGIHGNATCMLNFERAVGTLLGEPHKGLNVMFTFMNLARLGAGLQGLTHAELGLQRSLHYARQRKQGRSLKSPSGSSDAIIVHPDVRRMLLTQKSLAEGMRMLLYFSAKQVDIAQHAPDEDVRRTALEMLSVLTPIAKGFMTEVGFESANLALQCFGGHGYIRDWGVEQNVRDCRIASLYEGTTGVQALDLLGRKILLSNGQLLAGFTTCISHFCAEAANEPELSPYVETLAKLHAEWSEMTAQIGARALANPEEVGAASVDYLMYCGYMLLGYFWGRAARTSLRALAAGTGDEHFYRAKLDTARFYFERILPRTRTLVATIGSGADNLMSLSAEHFSFE